MFINVRSDTIQPSTANMLGIPIITACCQDNTVEVSGNGKVTVNPDIAKISVGITITRNTSKLATQGVATVTKQLNIIFTSNKIATKDVKTQSISIYPQYDWSNGTQKLIGQTASQTITVTIRNINSTGGIIGPLIDLFSAINGIQINGLTFLKQDNSDALKKARQLAFQDAKSKATDLACLASRNLGVALTIVDTSYSNSPVIYTDSFAKVASTAPDTSISVGTLDVSYSLSIKYQLC